MTLPLLSQHVRDKKGKLTKKFKLRVVSGRVYDFESKSIKQTEK